MHVVLHGAGVHRRVKSRRSVPRRPLCTCRRAAYARRGLLAVIATSTMTMPASAAKDAVVRKGAPLLSADTLLSSLSSAGWCRHRQSKKKVC